MRRTITISLTLAACFCGFSFVFAQPPQEGPGGRGGFGRMPVSPVQTALDANGDGQISAEELKDAEAKLKKLDANGDGMISVEELRPAGGRGFGGPGGPGGGPGGFGGGPGGGGNAEGLVNTIMGFDANKDGKVTKDEAPERLQGLFERADADKDGALTKTEIEKSVSGGMAGGRPGGREGGRPGEMRPGGFGGGSGEFVAPGNFVAMLARRGFEQQDANKDGKLSAEELTASMKENLKRIDTNEDGAVDLAELESLAKIFEPRERSDREGRGEGRPEGGRRPERE